MGLLDKKSSILGIVVSNHKIVHFCSSCIQSEDPFKDLNLPKKVKIYTEAIAKINYQKLFAVKIRNIADISNKRRKINKSSISAIFFIKLNEFLVCN